MEKIYLKDLEEEEIKNIIVNNESFMDMYRESLYDYNMEEQSYEYDMIFGKESEKFINCIDNYSSFHLQITDYFRFIDSIDKDYLTSNGLKLWEKAQDLKEKLYNIDYGYEEENENEITSEFEEVCDELLSNIEKELHLYEDYCTNDEVLDYIMINRFYDDYYTDNEKKIIYKDVIQVYK